MPMSTISLEPTEPSSDLDLQQPAPWLHYYVARLRFAVDDRWVSARELRQWMIEVLPDLAQFAEEQYPLSDTAQRAVQAAARQDHRVSFFDADDED